MQKTEGENRTEIQNLGDEMSYLKNENRFLKGELRVIQNHKTDQVKSIMK